MVTGKVQIVGAVYDADRQVLHPSDVGNLYLQNAYSGRFNGLR